MRVGGSALAVPPQTDAVAGEFTRVVTGAERDVTDVFGDVIHAMGNDHAVGETGEVVIVHLDRLVRVRGAGAEEFADQLPLFCVDADDRIASLPILFFKESVRNYFPIFRCLIRNINR